MSASRVSLLQQMPIFGGIDDAALAFLLERARTITMRKRAYFFCEGDSARSMFVLEQGSVAVLKAWEGEQHLLRYLATGDCFGEMALIDLSPRSASIRAVADCTAMELSPADFYDLYRQDTKAFTLIHMNLERELSRRLRTANEQLFQARMRPELLSEHATLDTI